MPISAFDGRSTLCIHCWINEFVSQDAYRFELNEIQSKYTVNHLHCGKEYDVSYEQIKQKKYRCPRCFPDGNNAYIPVAGVRRNYNLVLENNTEDSWVDDDLITKYMTQATRSHELAWVEMSMLKSVIPDYLRLIFNNATELNLSQDDILESNGYFSSFDYNKYERYLKNNYCKVPILSDEEKEINYNFLYYEIKTKDKYYSALVLFEKFELVINGSGLHVKGFNIFAKDGDDAESIKYIAENLTFYYNAIQQLNNDDFTDEAYAWLTSTLEGYTLIRNLTEAAGKIIKDEEIGDTIAKLDNTLKTIETQRTIILAKMFLKLVRPNSQGNDESASTEESKDELPLFIEKKDDKDDDSTGHSDDKDDDDCSWLLESDKALEDISFKIFEKNGLYIEFCNFEADDFGDIVMSFWVRNRSTKTIILKSTNISINGKVDNFYYSENIGTMDAGNSGYLKLCLDSSISFEGTYTVELDIDIFDLLNNRLEKIRTLSVDVDFDKETQKAKLNIDKNIANGWFNWNLTDYLLEYIKGLTCSNCISWVKTDLINRHGVHIYNKVYIDNMLDGDIICNGTHLTTIYFSMFESWLKSKGVEVSFSDEERNSHYELVYWNLQSNIDSKYEVLQLYAIINNKKVKRVTLFKSFNNEEFLPIIQDNVKFFDELPCLDNDEENLYRRNVYAINQERMAVFLKAYKLQYGLPCSLERLDKRVEKWKATISELDEKEKDLKRKKFLSASIYELPVSHLAKQEFRRHKFGYVAYILMMTKDDIRKISSRYIVEVFRYLDSQGYRTEEASKEKFPSIDDYFKNIFTCVSCGKTLDYNNDRLRLKYACEECRNREERLNSQKDLSLTGGYAINKDISPETLIFNMIIHNNTEIPIKVVVDEVSLFYGGSWYQGKIDSRFASFAEDYVFPKTERAFERVWHINNCIFKDSDYLTVYLTDKTNSKKYFYKYSNKSGSFSLTDFYVCDNYQ